MNNGLDEEEQAFQRRVDGEFRINDEDDDDEDDEEFGRGAFSSKDLDRLQMLERYRSNLIAGVSSNAASSSNDNNDDEESRYKQAPEGLRL